MNIPFRIPCANEYTGAAYSVQTLNWNTLHAPKECHTECGDAPATTFGAVAPGAAAGIRGGRSHPELHARGTGVVPDPGGDQPADPATGSRPGHALVRAPPPCARTDGGGPGYAKGRERQPRTPARRGRRG